MKDENLIEDIIELQTRCAHQEDMIHALTSVQREQQLMIDKLQLQSKWLAENLKQLKSVNTDSDGVFDDLPPHY